MGQIHEFILQRVYDDAAVALASPDRRAPKGRLDDSRRSGRDHNWGPRRVLTECETKREIVSTHDDGACPLCMANPEHGCETIRLLAKAWPDHPDYRDDWGIYYDGDSQLRPSRAAEIVEQLSRPGGPPGLELTDREIDVLRLIAEGASYRDIGRTLYVSVNTVRNHARNCAHKYQLQRRWGDGPGPAG